MACHAETVSGEVGGFSFGAVFDDLQGIPAFGLGEGSQAIMIDGQEVRLAEAIHELGIGAIGSAPGQVFDEEGKCMSGLPGFCWRPGLITLQP